MKVGSLVGLVLVAGMALTACGPQAKREIATDQTLNGILGGRDAVGTEDFAKTLVIVYDQVEGALCTGSILSDSIVLTAAHCIGRPENMAIVFGTDLKSEQIEARAVVATRQSPLWARRNSMAKDSGDIALVRFYGGLPPGFGPAELLTDSAELKKGAQVLLAGYGASRVIPSINGRSKHLDSGKLRSVTVPIADPAYSQTEVLLDQNNGRGACHGDSGGPAYAIVNGKKLLWGITHAGSQDPGDTCQKYSIYTSALPYAYWIKKTSAELDSIQVRAANNGNTTAAN